MFTVEVTLLRAVDLPASDFGFMGMGGKSDPYFVFKLGRETQQSSVIKKNLSPLWSPAEKFTFETGNPREHVLEVRGFDYDHGNKDDLLGTVSIALAPYVDKKGASEILSYELDVPAEFKSHNKISYVYLEVRVLSADRAERTLELHENQRYHLIKKWTTETTLPNDRKRWSAVNNADQSSDSFEVVAPPVPEGMVGDGWTLDISQGDAEGWMYAPSFQGPWERKAFSLALVRRRKWINICRVDAPEAANGSMGF
jgi:hypothetical protein